MILNTGTPRSITGHAISGGLMACMLSGTYAFMQYKHQTMGKQEAISNTLKATIEGGLITACAIGATNAIGDATKTPAQNIVKAATFVALGVAGVYGIQMLANKFCHTKTQSN